VSAEIIVIIIFCLMGLAAHGANKHPWMEWTLRVLFGFSFAAELYTVLVIYPRDPAYANPWIYAITSVMAASTGLMLFRPFRLLLSYFFTAINQLISGQFLIQLLRPQPVAVETKRVIEVPKPVLTNPSKVEPTAGEPTGAGAQTATERETQSPPASPAEQAVASDQSKGSFSTPGLCLSSSIVGGGAAATLFANRVFACDSVPHLNALWIYITVLGSLLANISMDSFKMPSIPFPLPVPIDVLFSYNFLGLVMLAVCGAGIFIARKPKEVLVRLGIVKPTMPQVGIAVAMIFVTAMYDYVWSLFTGAGSSSGVGSGLARYNTGTFAASGAGPAAIIALATGLFAGVGEETLVRGGLQPVFGILPAAFLHGALHGQFAHAPILVLQVAGWSTMMGIVRRYTNTTTTIITHAGWNIILTFLSAFNP
jgi:hypothetical protein